MWISHKSDGKIFSGIDVFLLTPLHWSSPRNKMLPNIQQTAVQENKPTLNHSSTGKINSIVPLQRIRLCMKHLGKHRENKFHQSFWSQKKNQLRKTQQRNYTVQVPSKLTILSRKWEQVIRSWGFLVFKQNILPHQETVTPHTVG